MKNFPHLFLSSVSLLSLLACSSAEKTQESSTQSGDDKSGNSTGTGGSENGDSDSTGGESNGGQLGAGGAVGTVDGGFSGELLLPTGVTLAIPQAPDRNADYDCSAENILCVPQEFATPQAASNAVAPGDTVVVSSGSFPGFEVTTTGTKAAPIQFIGLAGAKLGDFSTTDHGVVLRSDFDNDFYVDYIHVVGFIIDSPPSRCVYLTKAIASRPSRGHLIAQNVCLNAGREGFVLSQMSLSVVEDNIILNAGNGSDTAERDHGIYLSNGGTGDSLVRRNVIMGSSTNGIHFNGDLSVDTGGTDGIISGIVLDGNTIVGNGQNGFNMDGVQNCLFVNNVFYDNTRHAIRGYVIDGGAGPQDMVVIGNTFIGNNSAVKLSDGGDNNTVFNNLFANMNDEPIVVPPNFLQESNNVTSTEVMFESLPADLEGGTLTEIAAYDFRVTSKYRGILIDQGIQTLGGETAPEHDQRGETRSGTPDIGAREY